MKNSLAALLCLAALTACPKKEEAVVVKPADAAPPKEAPPPPVDAAPQIVDATTLHHKVLCGYQGWVRRDAIPSPRPVHPALVRGIAGTAEPKRRRSAPIASTPLFPCSSR